MKIKPCDCMRRITSTTKKMPKDKEKSKKFICSGCGHAFTTRHGLTTHRNSCLELRNPVSNASVTQDEEAPKKKKKTRRLLKRFLSKNSQTSTQAADNKVCLYLIADSYD